MIDTLTDDIHVGDDVWLGVDLGRVVGIEGGRYRVRFDRHPDDQSPSEGCYEAGELERATS